MTKMILLSFVFWGLAAQAEPLPRCEYLGYQFKMAKERGGDWYPVSYHAVGTKDHFYQTEDESSYAGFSIPLATRLAKIADLFHHLDQNKKCRFEPMGCGIGLVSQSQEIHPGYPEYYERGYNNEAFLRIGCADCKPAVEIRDYLGGLHINHVSTIYILHRGLIRSLSPDSSIGVVAYRSPINLYFLETRLRILKEGLDLLVQRGICKPVPVGKCEFKFVPSGTEESRYTDTATVESKLVGGYFTTLDAIEDKSYQDSVKDAFLRAGVCK